jgi:hypothetical protein
MGSTHFQLQHLQQIGLKSFFLWGFKENIGLVFMWVVKDTTTN